MWHHICVTWENGLGSWTFHRDGVLKQKGNLKKGYTITDGGTLVLGQDQDSLGGGFQTRQSYKGKLSLVNVWDRVLRDGQIKEMSISCRQNDLFNGNVFKWRDFLSEGGPKLVYPSPCKKVAVST